MQRAVRLLLLCGIVLAAAPLWAGSWPQFRGPNASGRPKVEQPLPAVVGPDTNVTWKTALPPGHSSPAIEGDQVFVTAARGDTLVTIALDRRTGEIEWEAAAPLQKLEEVHQVGSRAQPSPAADGERVVSFFGSCGLFCYDTAGNLLWKVPMGPFKNEFGSGSSPIIVGDRVILCQDHDTDSFLMALDKRDGTVLWKTDRSEFRRNYCTPVVWEVAGKKQIVLAATLRVTGYDLEEGRELWTVRGISRMVNTTPTVGDDGQLYVACWCTGGDDKDRLEVPPFAESVARNDKNGNGLIESEEVPDGPIQKRFTQIDRDKDGRIDPDEYDSMRRMFETTRNVVLAIRPGGAGDVTDSHIVWQYRKFIPQCPSPLYYRGRIFMIKDGGILSVLDAATGKPLKESRIKATGNYLSSPVASDGKIFLLSQRAVFTVLDADDFRELSSAELGGNGFATPAIVDGQLFVRTSTHLYCFGLR